MIEVPARPAITHRDYYEVLGVPRSASEDEIKAAYRALSRKSHPERHMTNREEKARIFMQLHEAYIVLTDPDSRFLYDILHDPDPEETPEDSVETPVVTEAPPPEPSVTDPPAPPPEPVTVVPELAVAKPAKDEESVVVVPPPESTAQENVKSLQEAETEAAVAAAATAAAGTSAAPLPQSPPPVENIPSGDDGETPGTITPDSHLGPNSNPISPWKKSRSVGSVGNRRRERSSLRGNERSPFASPTPPSNISKLRVDIDALTDKINAILLASPAPPSSLKTPRTPHGTAIKQTALVKFGSPSPSVQKVPLPDEGAVDVGQANVDAEAEAKVKADAEAKAKADADAKVEADAKAKVDAEAEEAKAKADAEAKARADADAKAKADADAKARADADAKAKADADAKAKAAADAEDEAKANIEAEAKAKAEAEATNAATDPIPSTSNQDSKNEETSAEKAANEITFVISPPQENAQSELPLSPPAGDGASAAGPSSPAAMSNTADEQRGRDDAQKPLGENKESGASAADGKKKADADAVAAVVDAAVNAALNAAVFATSPKSSPRTKPQEDKRITDITGHSSDSDGAEPVSPPKANKGRSRTSSFMTNERKAGSVKALSASAPPDSYDMADKTLPRALSSKRDDSNTPGTSKKFLVEGGKSPAPPIPSITESQVGTVPSEWVYPLQLPLQALYSGGRLRYRVTRYLLSGRTQESYADIEVKPGWKKGTKIRFAGLGNERVGLPPQDVIFVVDEAPHERFRREGANLLTIVDIPLLDALYGQRIVQGLDGKEIDVEVDFPGGVIRPGDISRVVGAGMPIRRSSEVVGRGDMLIKWNVVFPDSLTPKQQQFIRMAREAMDEVTPIS